MISWVFSLLALLFFPTHLYGEGLHLRAREHYETIDFGIDGVSGQKTYSGFTNTLHFGYEKPFYYLIGVSGSPLFATLSASRKPEVEDFGDKIRLVHLGLEAKGFPLPRVMDLFLRIGVYKATMQTNGSKGVLTGLSHLVGLGYEWHVMGVGVAPEMALRRGWLGDSVSFAGAAPAIGVHFYKMI